MKKKKSFFRLSKFISRMILWRIFFVVWKSISKIFLSWSSLMTIIGGGEKKLKFFFKLKRPEKLNDRMKMILLFICFCFWLYIFFNIYFNRRIKNFQESFEILLTEFHFFCFLLLFLHHHHKLIFILYIFSFCLFVCLCLNKQTEKNKE